MKKLLENFDWSSLKAKGDLMLFEKEHLPMILEMPEAPYGPMREGGVAYCHYCGRHLKVGEINWEYIDHGALGTSSRARCAGGCCGPQVASPYTIRDLLPYTKHITLERQEEEE